MLHRVRDVLGLRAVVIEAADGVGGTWYLNRYPGARCDSESYVYWYSFSEELLQEWEWSGKYPRQPEILAYLEHVTERFDLLRDIRLGTRVEAARYHDADGTWRVETGSGDAVIARFLVTGLGLLAAAPYTPDIPGLDTFAGECHHTGRWPHEAVDLEGRRVGVIGTGSTGVQAIPVIAEHAAHLHVFQRSPQFAVPAGTTPSTVRCWRRSGPTTTRSGRGPSGRSAAFPGSTTAARPWTPPPRRCGRPLRSCGARAGSGSCSAPTAISHRHQDQRPRRRLRAAEDPRDRVRPGDGREADADGPSVRRTAADHRHRLLRDLQPRRRDARRPAGVADRGGDSAGHPDHRRGGRARRARPRDGFRRRDGTVHKDRHHRSRRPDAA
ncbi:NAD(P)-binding domain-containing protein [Pseudonocardia sp. KRD-291]|nr:NAD(P)-binding domain-containing protein [Pseudonocardia sp. KRD291]